MAKFVCSMRPPLIAVLLATVASAVALSAASAAVSNTPQTRSWQANGRVSAIAVVGHTAYLGGAFTSMISPDNSRSLPRANLAAIDIPSGKLLPWHPTTKGAVLALKADGSRLLVGGAFTQVNGKNRSRIASLSLASGALTPGWNASANGRVHAIAVAGARVFYGGEFTRANARERGHLAAVSRTSGVIDTRWKASANGAVLALVADSGSGTLYAGGEFRTVNGHAAAYLEPISTATGGVKPWSVHPADRVITIALGAGRLFAGVGGHGGHLDAYNRPGGGIAWQRFTDGDVQAVAYSRGTVFTGGHFPNACRTSAGGGVPWVCAQPIVRPRLMTVSAATGELGPWNPQADTIWGVWTVKATSTHILAGGDFTHVSGIRRLRYAQFVR